MISNEMSKSVEVCGTQVPNHVDNNPVQVKAASSTDGSTSAMPVSDICTADSPQGNPSITECRPNYSAKDKNRTQAVRDSQSGSKRNNNNCQMLIEDFDENSKDNRNKLSRKSDGSRGDPFKRIGETAGAFSPYSVISDNNTGLGSPPFTNTLPLEAQLKNLQIVVDIPDGENLKEQISPKENKDEGTEKSKQSKDLENAIVDSLLVTVDSLQPKSKLPVPKAKDILNNERRAESPRGNADFDEIDFIRLEKERMRQMGLTDKFKNGRKEKKKKKNRRNNRGGTVDDGQDFDTLYRLPTEHLTRHRHNSICGKDRNIRTVEEQLRLHEELNERRRLVEMEREHNYGAVGGYPDIEENLIGERPVTFEAGNISPTSEHSRDSSPTNEDVNLRRFER